MLQQRRRVVRRLQMRVVRVRNLRGGDNLLCRLQGRLQMLQQRRRVVRRLQMRVVRVRSLLRRFGLMPVASNR